MSGVMVATINKSISAGLSLASASAALAAAEAICEVDSSGPAMRRSRMPVRVKIHSSDVSTRCESSSLVTILVGA